MRLAGVGVLGYAPSEVRVAVGGPDGAERVAAAVLSDVVVVKAVAVVAAWGSRTARKALAEDARPQEQ